MARHKRSMKRSPLQEVTANAIRKAKVGRLTNIDSDLLKDPQDDSDAEIFFKSSDESFVLSPCSEKNLSSNKDVCEGSDIYDENNLDETSLESSQTSLGSSFCNDTSLANVLLLKPDTANAYRTPGTSRHIWRSPFISVAVDYFDELDIPSEVIIGIFKYLNKKDLNAAMLTCRRFYFAGCDSSLWETVNLSERNVSEAAVHTVLERGAKVLVLSGTSIRDSESSSWANTIEDVSWKTVKLSYADFSKIFVSDISIIVRILQRCTLLQAIAFENNTLEDSVLKAISKNSFLKYLCLPMCQGYTSAGLKYICKGCKNLIEANFAWSSFTADHVEVLCNNLPASLQRLDISGIINKDALSDADIVNLTNCCPKLTDIDISDAPSITAVSMKRLLGLPLLKGLTVSRCYSIDATAFMLARKLSYLNVFGCITESGQELLRRHLRNVRVNENNYTDIARPTRSVDRNMSFVCWERASGTCKRCVCDQKHGRSLCSKGYREAAVNGIAVFDWWNKSQLTAGLISECLGDSLSEVDVNAQLAPS
uniref:F-box domain-containing protein n=1 Tax=Syphacia muris TaxID=451379 RepID=A0A0N5B048_9BILA